LKNTTYYKIPIDKINVTESFESRWWYYTVVYVCL